MPSGSDSEANFGFVEFVNNKVKRDEALKEFNGKTIQNFEWVTFDARGKIKKLELDSPRNSTAPVVGAEFLNFQGFPKSTGKGYFEGEFKKYGELWALKVIR